VKQKPRWKKRGSGDLGEEKKLKLKGGVFCFIASSTRARPYP
jgi:hypothetical protein